MIGKTFIFVCFFGERGVLGVECGESVGKIG